MARTVQIVDDSGAMRACLWALLAGGDSPWQVVEAATGAPGQVSTPLSPEALRKAIAARPAATHPGAGS